jgi:hypothetical protein
LGGGERGNSPWNMLHGGERSAGGERRGERRPVVVVTGSWLGEKSGAQVVLAVTSVGRFCGRRCRSMWMRFSVAMAARGGLRSAPSSGQWFGEEAQVRWHGPWWHPDGRRRHPDGRRRHPDDRRQCHRRCDLIVSLRIIVRHVQIREENLYLLFTLLLSICSIFICRSDQALCQHGCRQ